MASPPFLPDENKPGDSDIVSQFPAVERLFRDIVETWLLIDHDTSGQHKQLTLPERGSDPSNATDIGFVYTKNDSGDTELFYEDAGGNVVQITADGSLSVVGILDAPTNTVLFFYQTAAPAGWTKDTNATLGNHALKLVTNVAWSGGTKGATAFDSVFGSGKVSGGTQLTSAQSGTAAHTHGMNPAGSYLKSTGGSISPAGGGTWGAVALNTAASSAVNAASTHNHTVSLDLNHIQVIRCTKN